MIPRITRLQLLAAMTDYDLTIRGLREDGSWEHNQAHKWCILSNHKRYPIKQLVGMAARVDPSTFTGGDALNKRIAKLGFTVAPLDRSSAPAEPKVEDDAAATIAQLRQQVEALQLALETATARQALLCAALTTVQPLVAHALDCQGTPCNCEVAEALAQAHQALALAQSSAPERKAARP